MARRLYRPVGPEAVSRIGDDVLQFIHFSRLCAKSRARSTNPSKAPPKCRSDTDPPHPVQSAARKGQQIDRTLSSWVRHPGARDYISFTAGLKQPAIDHRFRCGSSNAALTSGWKSPSAFSGTGGRLRNCCASCPAQSASGQAEPRVYQRAPVSSAHTRPLFGPCLHYATCGCCCTGRAERGAHTSTQRRRGRTRTNGSRQGCGVPGQ